MANAFPQTIVDGPARVAAPYGLFSVLAFREPLDKHWEGAGVTWQSLDGSKNLGVFGAVQTDPDNNLGSPKTFERVVTIETAGVFTLYGQQKITPMTWTQEAASARARDLLLGLEERAVERVLGGVVSGLPLNFADATPFTSSQLHSEVIAELEGFIAENYGSRGVIHMSRLDASNALSARVLETRGNGLSTRLGTPVAAGSGYAEGVAYCSSSLLAHRSDVFDSSGQPYDNLDKETNDLYAIAERTYSIGYEALALGAVTITPLA